MGVVGSFLSSFSLSLGEGLKGSLSPKQLTKQSDNALENAVFGDRLLF